MTKQWNKLPVGTKVLYQGRPNRIVDKGLLRGPYADDKYLHVAGDIFDTSDPEEESGLQIDPSEFADATKRDELGKLGFFSIDDPKHRRKREREAHHAMLLEQAYDTLGLSRDGLLNRIAGILDDQHKDGIWATSTIEYAKKREAVDNAILYATGKRDHA